MGDADRTAGRSTLIVVRVGAIDRFAALESAFGPKGVGVVWDRRVRDRRRRDGESAVATERRHVDRRGPPPSSWTLLDFLVVSGLPLAS